MLNKEIYVKFKTVKDLPSEFKVNKCLIQEEEITPLLLNIMLEMAIRRSTVEPRGNIFDKYGQIMANAMMWLLWEED
jgi:hypothetical protein